LALKGKSGSANQQKESTSVEGFLEMDRKLTEMQEQNRALEQKLKQMSDIQEQQSTTNNSEVLQDMLA
jgi:hypothetical protein